MTLRTTAARVRAGLSGLFCRLAHRTLKRELSPSQILLLQELLQGDRLKSHRYLDGGKEYRLHPLNGRATQVPAKDVRRLEDLGLLFSNHKFPAATFFLSQRGRRVAADWKDSDGSPPIPKFSAETH